MKTIIEAFKDFGKENLIESFKKYWNKNGEILSDELEIEFKNSIDIMFEIGNSKPEMIENISVFGDWVIDEIRPYLGLYGRHHDNFLRYSIAGTDWDTQLFWVLDINNIDQTDVPEESRYSYEDILGILLYELTFFGSTPEIIKQKFKKNEKEITNHSRLSWEW